MRSCRLLALVLLCALPTSAEVSSGEKNCTCGFYDSQTQQLFTDSIIVYFNETTNLPDDFVAENYVLKYDQDWGAIYRQGATPANVRYNESESLQLFVEPATKERLVKGGGIRTIRRDIQHGSFRTLIKPSTQASGGTAMSMMWKYNETEVTELSAMNTNNNSDAWVGNFVNNEFTTRDKGIGFEQLLEQKLANRNYTTLSGGMSNGSVDAWDYTEYRIDWTQDSINFYTGGDLTRQVLHKDNHALPSVPSSFFFKHWSTGNRWSMEGPPEREAVANVRWIRMFFNSSSMSEAAREDFVTSCSLAEACLMNDVTLRGSSPYTAAALQTWQQDNHRDFKRMPALWLSVGCIAFSTFLLIHTFIRRMKQPKTSTHGHAPSPTAATESITGQNKTAFGEKDIGEEEESEETFPHHPPLSIRPPSSTYSFADDLAIEQTPPVPSLFNSKHDTPSGNKSQIYKLDAQQHSRDSFKRINMDMVTQTAFPAPRMTPHPLPAHQRIDHLAGLVALCTMVVTFMHFGLTFIPGIVPAGTPELDHSVYWTQTFVAPVILHQMWLGIFLTTSVRFLVTPYLRKGKVEDIARAATRRTPRLMIPVASIALLEYFLIDVGATKYLRYIPSLSWSTYPYVTTYENFGEYVSEVIKLVFMLPNAVPQISLHYCTGVLWTIVVQLEGSWLVLLGVMIIYEIKSPWKRMVFFTFCVVNHWYAQSWGSYLWLGLVLTDLDITFQWKSYLSTRPGLYYPLITFLWFCVAVGFAVDLIPEIAPGDFPFSTLERNIHPDSGSGDALVNTGNKGHPDFYTPRFNGLLAAGGMQAVVELSSSVQWILSTRPFTLLFPHIFTIYLLHGFVFWSWGSWLMVLNAERDFSYGINVAIVGVTSYAILFLSLPIVTPILDALGRDITALVWMTAQEKAPPRRRTLYPFPEDLFSGRAVNAKEGTQPNLEAGLGHQAPSSDAIESKRDSGGTDSDSVPHAITTDGERKETIGTNLSRFSHG